MDAWQEGRGELKKYPKVSHLAADFAQFWENAQQSNSRLY